MVHPLKYRLSFANKTRTAIPQKKCKMWLEVCSRYIKRPRFAGERIVILTFVGDQQIKKLNRFYRHKDCVTDVISLEYPPSTLKNGVFGEIFICVPQARRQAKKLGHRLWDELVFLFVHGFLHVHGYDHEKPTDEKVMFALTDKIMDGIAKMPKKR